MQGFILEYIKPELLVLIPVLWILGKGIKKSKLPDRVIPAMVGAAGILLASLYVFSGMTGFTFGAVLQALFAGITQGVLCAGGSVYAHELGKSIMKVACAKNEQTPKE